MDVQENMIKNIYEQLTDDIPRVVIKTYYNEYVYNFSTIWTDQNAQTIKHSIAKETNKLMWRSISKFLDGVTIHDKSHPDYWNLCTIEVSRDGSYQIDFAYKPELDEENEKETIESIGQELYDQYQREDRERREQATQQPEAVTEPQAFPQPEELTIPELLGFISSELQKDLPADWAKLIVNAEVFEEDAKQAVSMVSYYVAGNADPQRFTPSNNIGPMNALLRFHKQLAQQGQQWRKATLTFDVNGGVEMQSE